ncbi:hypothetical protein LTR70_007531 [Exophiala xenobiotica]|uniref:Uncharacterized protein n=1 Tax=Lithohypha guttulata TaxID=1690604 RepID=A0ABR0K1P1_9EURO|nr:hypothetical protein LTR24_007870 [Lithohypha guttulata]KAK5313590.1 hypothetical protein LTR70_007531 [Exophiala xenobiotica]
MRLKEEAFLIKETRYKSWNIERASTDSCATSFPLLMTANMITTNVGGERNASFLSIPYAVIRMHELSTYTYKPVERAVTELRQQSDRRQITMSLDTSHSRTSFSAWCRELLVSPLNQVSLYWAMVQAAEELSTVIERHSSLATKVTESIVSAQNSSIRGNLDEPILFRNLLLEAAEGKSLQAEAQLRPHSLPSDGCRLHLFLMLRRQRRTLCVHR